MSTIRNQSSLLYSLLLIALLLILSIFTLYTNAYSLNNIFKYFYGQKCGYASCNLGKPGYLNVHLIPHTHDDVGWLKTVDQYYYGANNTIQRAGVQYILDSVIQALVDDPKRRFTYVEMAFFVRWWASQTLAKRQIVKDLVQSGRLQFALGGWTMADEATVYYSDAIDQLTRGRDVLKQLFGDCGLPLVAWQIDPFGHSRDHSDLLQDAGFDAVYFQRMDYREKLVRKRLKQLEVLWDTDIQLKSTGKGLFTSMFHDSYCYPKSFCFDDKCLDEPIKDDPTLEGYNVKSRVDDFLNYIDIISKAFKTNHVMVLMGCDFTYENANMNYKNMDKLIAYVNQRQKLNGSQVNLLYSTPACYTKAVNDAFNQIGTITRRGGDFFPYASGPYSYWTGYYTSRPALKYYVRQASNLLAMCEHVHLHVDHLSQIYDYQKQITTDELIDSLRRTLGVLQHHDAVSGTEKQHVANDYAWRLSTATKFGQLLISQSLIQLLPTLKPFIDKSNVIFCNLLNISLCDATEGFQPHLIHSNEGGIFIILYNPLAWEQSSTWIRLPIYIPEDHSMNLQVILNDLRIKPSSSSTNIEHTTNLQYQLIPITERTFNIPERQSDKHLANYEILFNAKSLSPMGFNLFYLALNNTTYNHNSINSINNHLSLKYIRQLHTIPNLLPMTTATTTTTTVHMDQSISRTIQFNVQLIDNLENPVIITMKHLNTGLSMNLSIEMLYYYGETSYPQSSGAYIFLPKYGTFIHRFTEPSVKVIEGSCVKEFHLTYASWASLVIRLYNNGELEVEWTAGPIPDDGYTNSRELVIRYTVNNTNIFIKNPGEFFTDSSGRRMIKRLRNKRIDWNLPINFTETENIAGNYYPVVNRIMLKNIILHKSNENPLEDEGVPLGLAIYTDRAHGGTSLHDGQIELMLHRRLVRDDGFGVSEPLMENGLDGRGLIVRGIHKIRFDELDYIELEDRRIAQLVSRPIIPLFMHAKHQPKSMQVNGWSGLNIGLPNHIHLLSLTSWPLNKVYLSNSRESNQILIRLENLQSSNSLTSIKPCTIDITYLINGIKIIGMKEMILTADQLKTTSLLHRLNWPTELPSYDNYTLYTKHKCNADNLNSNGVLLTIEPGKIVTYILDYEITK
ncbi:Lysosomal alpha-mannosidase [Schistosoma japonicum]|nr:Lysosomal alpha-mannosidase [Schistosoma japonicum]